MMDALDYFSRDALADAEAEADGRSRAAVFWMSPEVFLQAALSGHDPGKERNVADLIKLGTRFSSIPFLGVVNLGDRTARVHAHEGRHRMRALQALGIQEVPVLIKVYDGEHGFRWSVPDDTVRPHWLRPEGGGGQIVPLGRRWEPSARTPRAAGPVAAPVRTGRTERLPVATPRHIAAPRRGPAALPRSPSTPTALPAPFEDVRQHFLNMKGEVHREFTYGDSRILYRTRPEGVYLISLRTPSAKRRKGSARRAMAAFLLQVDHFGQAVTLSASPLDAKTSRGRLVQFYASLGFRPTGRTVNPVGDPELRRPAREHVERNRTHLDPRAAWGERLGQVLPQMTPLMQRQGSLWKGIAERETPWSLGGCWVLAQALVDHFGAGAKLMGVSSQRGECFHVLAYHAGGWWDDHGFHADIGAATWIQKYLGIPLTLHPFQTKHGDRSGIPFSFKLAAGVKAALQKDPVLAHPPGQPNNPQPLPTSVVESCPCGVDEDPAEWLREDHAEIRAYANGIAKQIKQKDYAGAQRALQILTAELDVHFRTEEDSVFARLAAQQHLSAAGRRRLAALRQEHAGFRADLSALPQSATLTGFAELHRRLEVHADAEDALLLPK